MFDHTVYICQCTGQLYYTYATSKVSFQFGLFKTIVKAELWIWRVVTHLHEQEFITSAQQHFGRFAP